MTGAAAVIDVLTVATTATTTAGSYTVTVTGTSGSLITDNHRTVTVTAPPAELRSQRESDDPEPPRRHNRQHIYISVTPSGGFIGNVALACSVTGPSGATSPATCA